MTTRAEVFTLACSLDRSECLDANPSEIRGALRDLAAMIRARTGFGDVVVGWSEAAWDHSRRYLLVARPSAPPKPMTPTPPGWRLP